MRANLGDEVRDAVTQYVGIVVAKTQWLNGCLRYAVQKPVKKNSSEIPLEPQWVDEPQAIVLRRGVVPGPEDEIGLSDPEKPMKKTGGPKPAPPRFGSVPKR